MSYTQIFGGTTIYPSDVSLLALILGADKELEWPLESNDPANPAARIIDVTASGSYSVILPDATQTGPGQTLLFNNLPASSSAFTIKDNAGNTIATVGIGEQWQVYLAVTTTAAGTWRVFRYGASTATVQASALAGYGLTVTSGTLSQSMEVTTFSSSPRTLLATDRARAFVWTGTGSGVFDLRSAALIGNNFFIAVRNSGGGDLVIDAAGSDLIDGTATLTLRPGESTQLITDGLAWYTLGLGQEAVFAFDYTSITVTGGTYTLAGSELNRIVYKFLGTLAADQYIVVPNTVQQYWVDNATTGPYSLFLRTSGGTPVAVTQGSRGIYYCNGANVVDADTATISLPVSASDGGTGITSYTAGDLLYASGASTLAKLSDIATGNALLSGGVGSIPLWGKVGLTTHVTGTLPVASGGTGAGSFTANRLLKGNGTSAFSTSIISDDGTTASVNGSLTVTGPQEFRGATQLSDYTASGFGASTGIVSFEHGIARTGDGDTYFDLHAQTGVDFNARILRSSGVNGAFELINTGAGNFVLSNSGNAPLLFQTNGTERLRINSAGNVGIGTATPVVPLDVVGQINATGSVIIASGQSYRFGTGGVRIEGNTATDVMAFLNAGGTERMRITAAGNTTLGTTDDNINSGVGVKLRGASAGQTIASVSAATTSGDVGLSMYSTGAAAYRFYVSWDGKINCTSTTIAAISDVRMKENIRDLDYGLDTILALQPRRFDWKTGKGKNTKNDIGFIAQEAELVMPEMVGSWLPGPGDPADLKSLSAAELIPVFVKAIQELAARVAELEGRVA